MSVVRVHSAAPIRGFIPKSSPYRASAVAGKVRWLVVRCGGAYQRDQALRPYCVMVAVAKFSRSAG